jgi:CheY-like chemotaxis protein
VEKRRWRNRVLVVDDNRVITDMFAEMLGHLGYLSVVCNDPRDALTLFTRNPERFDAVILDEIMPSLRGTELTGQLLRIRNKIPVILLTGHGGLVTMEQIYKSGARATLIKPVFQADLRLVLERVLK